jgi:hypothetical protein
MRTAVIVVEECWPLSGYLDESKSSDTLHRMLIRAAESTKMKDAAGLGSLAYALSQGDSTVLVDPTATRDIRIVAAAIDRPADFWNWVAKEGISDRQELVLRSTHRAYRRGGWPWDRAFMIAAAYLAATGGVPEVKPASKRAGPLDWWVALDKHTPEGKRAISEAAKELSIPVRRAIWLSFYFESAVSNAMLTSPWWEREIAWRLRKLGMEYEEAEELWARLRPLVAGRLHDEANRLRSHISGIEAVEQTSFV